MNKLISFLTAACLFAPVFATGSDIETRQANLYPYKSSIFLQDDFVSGVNANGTTGALGWVVNGGTTTAMASTSGLYGVIRKDTTAASGTVAQISLYSSAAAVDIASPQIVLFRVRPNMIDSDTVIRVGAGNALTSNPPDHGVYLERLGADANWHCVTRAATVQTGTRIDSTVAITTNLTTIQYASTGTSIQFFIDGVAVCGAMTANLPTTLINPGLQIVNGAAASKNIDIDYFQMQISGLSR